MLTEIAFLVESNATVGNLALERLLPGVNPQVAIELVQRGEYLAAPG